MIKGSQPTDDGNFFLSAQEREELISKYPDSEKFIKQFIGAKEFIDGKLRYCFWLKDQNPNEYKKIPGLKDRLKKIVEFRKKSPTESVKKDADIPYLFTQIRQPSSGNYLVFPRHSGANRKYIPIGFMPSDVIAGDACSIVPNANLYHFGILTSSVHMAWTRVVCGRLKEDFRYNPSVYNNFVWPTVTEEQKNKIEEKAKKILDARQLSNMSLLDMYSELTMPKELIKAHRENDKIVMEAYGFNSAMNDEDIVTELMKEYSKRVKEIEKEEEKLKQQKKPKPIQQTIPPTSKLFCRRTYECT